MKEYVGRLTTSSLRLCGAEDGENMLVEGVDACASSLGWGVSSLEGVSFEAFKRANAFNKLSSTAQHFALIP